MRCRAAPALLLAAALAGCAPPAPPGALQVRSIARERVLVTAGEASVAVAPPAGFCVVPDSVRTAAEAVFVLIGPCPGQEGRQAADLLTASVSGVPLFTSPGDRAGDLDRLEDFLGSPAGLALVGRGGGPGELRILETYREGDGLVLLVEDRGARLIPDHATRFWRALVEVNGRMVSLSVSALQGRDAEDRAQLALLRAFIAAIRAANAPPFA